MFRAVKEDSKVLERVLFGCTSYTLLAEFCFVFLFFKVLQGTIFCCNLSIYYTLSS